MPEQVRKMSFKLRPYQKDVIERVLATNENTLIQIPTGGGKTVISKEIIRALINKSKQVVFVVPKIVLMNQTIEVFKELRPHVVHGNNDYNRNNHLLISTIQTASKRNINPDVIFIDEIHFGYEGKMIKSLLENKPNTRVIGLSATPYDKNGNLLQGFDVVIDKYDLKYMVQNGYLVNIESYKLVHIYNLHKLKITAGDYNSKELSGLVSSNQTILEVVNSTLEYINHYNKAIVFAVDINHAELLTKAYLHKGVKARVLHSKMKQEHIDKEINFFKIGQTKVLVSVLMLTTGFDVPDTDVVVMARPTKSQNLYKQMIGRVLRLAENKSHAVLLDCGNVIDTLGLPLEPIKEKESNNTRDSNKCKNCGSINLKLTKINNKACWICKDCGFCKDINEGTYECMLCKRKYTHNANFKIENNKLYLVCEKCPYPSLISEFTGKEAFIMVDGLEAKIFDKNKIEEFLSFEDARTFVRKLKLTSIEQWTKYKKGELKNLQSKPANIPDKPQLVYKEKGWVSFSDWLGLDKLIDKKISLIKKYIQNKNLKKLYKIYSTYPRLAEEKSIELITKDLPLKEFRYFISMIDENSKSSFMNYALKINDSEKFILIAEQTYSIKHTREYKDGKFVDIDQPYCTQHKFSSQVDTDSLIHYFDNYYDISSNIIQHLRSNLDSLDDDIKLTLLIKSTENKNYEFGKDVVKSGFSVDLLCWNMPRIDFSELEKYLKLYKNQWEIYNFSSELADCSAQSTDCEWDGFHDNKRIAKLFSMLHQYDIKIVIDEYQWMQPSVACLIEADDLDAFKLLYENTNLHAYKIVNLDVLQYALIVKSNNIITYLIDSNFTLTLEHFYISVLENNKLSIIKRLYNDDYNLDLIADENGRTLLDIAYEKKDMRLVSFLLSSGASKRLRFV